MAPSVHVTAQRPAAQVEPLSEHERPILTCVIDEPSSSSLLPLLIKRTGCVLASSLFIDHISPSPSLHLVSCQALSFAFTRFLAPPRADRPLGKPPLNEFATNANKVPLRFKPRRIRIATPEQSPLVLEQLLDRIVSLGHGCLRSRPIT